MAETLLNPYCVEQEVRDEIKNSDATLSDQIIRAINMASRWVDQYTGRDFYLHDYSSTALSLSVWEAIVAENRLYLPFPHVIALTQVTEAQTVLTEGTDFIQLYDKKYREAICLARLGTPTYLWMTRPGYIWIDEPEYRRALNVPAHVRWLIGEPPNNQLQLKGKFGYDQSSSAVVPTGLPNEIRWATIQVAAAMSGYNRKEMVSVDGSKESIIDRTIPKAVYEMLGRRGPILI